MDVAIMNGNVGIGTTSSGAKLELAALGTTTDGLLLSGNSLTTGNLILGTNTITADGLTARTAGNNLVDLSVSRTEQRTSGTTADDFDLMSLIRTSVTEGAGGTLTAAGSVLHLENVVTQTAGTLTDTVSPLEVVQDVNSTGGGILINMLTADNGFIDFRATEDADATSALSSLTTAGALQGFIQVLINGTAEWIPRYADPS